MNTEQSEILNCVLAKLLVISVAARKKSGFLPGWRCHRIRQKLNEAANGLQEASRALERVEDLSRQIENNMVLQSSCEKQQEDVDSAEKRFDKALAKLNKVTADSKALLEKMRETEETSGGEPSSGEEPEDGVEVPRPVFYIKFDDDSFYENHFAEVIETDVSID